MTRLPFLVFLAWALPFAAIHSGAPFPWPLTLFVPWVAVLAFTYRESKRLFDSLSESTKSLLAFAFLAPILTFEFTAGPVSIFRPELYSGIGPFSVAYSTVYIPWVIILVISWAIFLYLLSKAKKEAQG